MRYLCFLFLLLQQLPAFAQLPELQSAAELEHYLAKRYGYKKVGLEALNPVVKDSVVSEPAPPAYWLKGDFNHDGKTDLLVSASITLKKGHVEHRVFIVASEGRGQVKVDVIDPGDGFNLTGSASYSVYANADKQYVVITTWFSEIPRLATGGWARNPVYTITRDTLFLRDNRPLMYTAHPANQVIAYLKFERTACFGTCPVFKATIGQDGSVDYTGIEHVDRLGHHTLLLSKEKLGYLTSLLGAIKLPALKNEYHVAYTDAPTAYLTVGYADGRVKTIKDYGLAGTYGLALLYRFLTDLRNF